MEEKGVEVAWKELSHFHRQPSQPGQHWGQGWGDGCWGAVSSGSEASPGTECQRGRKVA